jgi:hypothetical protein
MALFCMSKLVSHRWTHNERVQLSHDEIRGLNYYCISFMILLNSTTTMFGGHSGQL